MKKNKDGIIKAAKSICSAVNIILCKLSSHHPKKQKNEKTNPLFIVSGYSHEQ